MVCAASDRNLIGLIISVSAVWLCNRQNIHINLATDTGTWPSKQIVGTFFGSLICLQSGVIYPVGRPSLIALPRLAVWGYSWSIAADIDSDLYEGP